MYQKDKLKEGNFISQRGKPYTKLTDVEQRDMNDLSNLLDALHSAPAINKLDLKNIVEKIKEDPVMS